MTETQKKTVGLAIASLVLGILGFVALGILVAIPAVICGHMAKSRIKNSDGTLQGDGLALAGLIMGYVCIGITVLMIPLLAAIAIPSFLKARDSAQRFACINNLQMMDAAKVHLALESGKTPGTAVTHKDVERYYVNETALVCPAQGTYTLNPIGTDPVCSIDEHVLE